MSAFGGTMNYSLLITAKDETQGPLSGVQKGFSEFAKTVSKPIEVSLKLAGGALALARDINLGIKPLFEAAVRGIDSLVERGGRLEVVQKTFQNLFDVPDRDAFARRLVDASGGMLKLADAIGLANKAASADVGIRDIPTIFEFGAKRAAAFGESAEEGISALIQAFHAGNFRFLKQLGVDIGDVADQFEQLTQGGKLSGLDFAARKAEVISTAIAKMKDETGKFNVSGRESIFLWTRLKNEISDSVDKLALAVVKNDSFKAGLTEFRNLFGGMAQHLEGGGSIWDVLFGKEGGKSGGMLGLLKAGLLDAGEALGRGILGGILVGISKLPELFGAVKQAAAPLMAEIKEKKRELDDWTTNKAIPWLGTQGKKVMPTSITDYSDTTVSPTGRVRAGPVDTFFNLMGDVLGGGGWKNIKQDVKDSWVYQNLAKSIPGVGMGYGFGTGAPSVLTGGAGEWLQYLAPMAGQAGRQLLSGGVLGGESRFRDEFGRVKSDFPYNAGATLPDWIDPAEFRFTSEERAKRKAQIAHDRHNLARINRGESIDGGPSLRTQANRDANAYMRQLHGQGLYVSPRQRKYFYDRRLQELKEEQARPLSDQIDAEGQDIVRSDSRRDFDRQAMLYGRRVRGSRTAIGELERAFGSNPDRFTFRYPRGLDEKSAREISLDRLNGQSQKDNLQKFAEMGKAGFEAVRRQIDELIGALKTIGTALVGEEGQVASAGNRQR